MPDSKGGLHLPLLIWRMAFGLLLVACLSLAGIVWWAGEAETQRAFESGRRVLVMLADGSITDGRANPSLAPLPELKPTLPEAAPDSPAPEAVKPPEAPKTEAVPDESTAAPEQEAVVKGEVAVEVVVPPEEKFDLSNLPSAGASATPINDYNPSLAEKTEVGMLPVISYDGTKPWRYYAKSFSQPGGTSMIAIVVTGLGQSKTLSQNAMKLPENVSLGFSPYAKELKSWGTSARATGHEIMLELPLEPSNYPVTDPGPYGMLAERGVIENEKHLQWSMSRLPVYTGFITPPNESFSSNGEAFRQMLQSLSNRGLMLLMSREPAKDETKDIIDSTHAVTVVADMLIDEDLSVSVIQARLASLEQLAKKNGHAVGIAQAYPVTLEQIYQWSQALAEKGIVLVPVTTIARLRFS